MHDIDERLTQLGGSLEAAAEVRSPTQVRSRGEQIRVAHRRRMTTVAAVTAAVAVIGVGSLVAFRPAGHKGAPVGPGTAGTSSTSSTSSKAVTPPSGATSAAAGQLIAVVDLAHDAMKVYDGHGQVVKTLPVTAGTTAHPTPVGIFSITAKQQDMKIQSGPTSATGDSYDYTAQWAITLDSGPSLYAEPSASGAFGTRNITHGDVEMSTDSAQWLYDHVAVGDRIQIQ